jgi:hypothetical protein
MATTRLRRTFHYPSDSDDPPDLDEEHQETLLHDLEATDKKTSTLYRNLFLALPALTALYAILNPNIGHARLGRPPATATALFLTLLQIAVPVLAGWVLYYHPVTVPGSSGGLMSFDAFSGNGTSNAQPGDVKLNARRLIVLGLSLSGMLVIAAGMKWSLMSVDLPAYPEGQAIVRRSNGEYGDIANLLLPAGMYNLSLYQKSEYATDQQNTNLVHANSRFLPHPLRPPATSARGHARVARGAVRAERGMSRTEAEDRGILSDFSRYWQRPDSSSLH